MSMPSAEEWARLIARVGKGAKFGMETCGLVPEGCNQEQLCQAFVSLDLALQRELDEDEKSAMGYNVIMLEHALCKINRLKGKDFYDAVNSS